MIYAKNGRRIIFAVPDAPFTFVDSSSVSHVGTQPIFKFSADSLPRFGTTSKLTFAPSARPS